MQKQDPALFIRATTGTPANYRIQRIHLQGVGIRADGGMRVSLGVESMA